MLGGSASESVGTGWGNILAVSYGRVLRALVDSRSAKMPLTSRMQRGANFAYKTEGLIGYTTLFGDSACAFNPIGDLYKSQVRQLAAASEYGVFSGNRESLRKLTEGILHRIPRYRQKIQWTPLTRQPVWVDDADFSLFAVAYDALLCP